MRTIEPLLLKILETGICAYHILPPKLSTCRKFAIAIPMTYKLIDL